MLIHNISYFVLVSYFCSSSQDLLVMNSLILKAMSFSICSFFLAWFHMTKLRICYCLCLSIYLTAIDHFYNSFSYCSEGLLHLVAALSRGFIIAEAMIRCKLLSLLSAHLSAELLKRYLSLRSLLLPITTAWILSCELFLT